MTRGTPIAVVGRDATVVEVSARAAALTGWTLGEPVPRGAEGWEKQPTVCAALGAGVHLDEPGAIAVVRDGSTTPVGIELERVSAGFRLVEVPVAAEPSFDLLARLRGDAAHGLSHHRRSPLVRAAGRVELARRVASGVDRGDNGAVDDQLRELASELARMLVVADAEVAAVAEMSGASDARDDLTTSAFVEAVRGRCVGEFAPAAFSCGVSRLLVVIPSPRPAIVGAVASLVTHLAACWPSVATDVVFPGARLALAELTAAVADSSGGPAIDVETDAARLALGAGWPSGDAGAFGALADVATLSAGGVRLLFHGEGDPSASLRLGVGIGVVDDVGPGVSHVLSPHLSAVVRGARRPC